MMLALPPLRWRSAEHD
jgi:hypothetical protein